MSIAITTQEIAYKLYSKRPIWLRRPKISILKDEDRRFGHIQFDFNEPGESDPDEIERIGVMFSVSEDENDDYGLSISQAMLMAQEAVRDFKKLLREEEKKWS